MTPMVSCYRFLPALSRGSIEVDSQSDGSMSDDPQADFAAMRASVVAKKASNFSTLSAVQSAASSRNFRSAQVIQVTTIMAYGIYLHIFTWTGCIY